MRKESNIEKRKDSFDTEKEERRKSREEARLFQHVKKRVDKELNKEE